MRIIAGKYRGKKLFTPQDLNVRPTAERAREALFSILYSRLGNFTSCEVLDVFAGTGAFGFEALSRGAKCVSFIDKEPKLVMKNAALFPAEKTNISIIKADVSNLPRAAKAYNLIFMDAPYAKGLSAETIQNLRQKNWLSPDALCLIETRYDEALDLPEDFVPVDERCYGLAKIRFYVYKG